MNAKGNEGGRLPSSFRDVAGFVFEKDGVLYRQVNHHGARAYDRLMSSGLYRKLVDERLLIPHEEVSIEGPEPSMAYKIIAPAPVPFISHPYEWCFSQLKDAALATLRVQECALEFGMMLRDASAYNMQFVGGRPVLIDTLSFKIYEPGEPWPAYKQFCQHFLGPLALKGLRDRRLAGLTRVYIDGLPLDLASALLPLRTHASFGLQTHIHLHARSQRRYAAKPGKAKGAKLHEFALRALIDSLKRTVAGCRLRVRPSAWSEYYASTNYTAEALARKEQLVAEFLDEIRPQMVWDLGANVGRFSFIAAEKAIQTVGLESDHVAVELSYLECRNRGVPNFLPLVQDLSNPSPSLGWGHAERQSLEQRGPSDMLLMLAIVHHLAIGNNVPLHAIADFAARLGKWLVVEFIPKDDSQVQRLLASREDIFESYTQSRFEAEFQALFRIKKSVPITGSKRTLYLMQNRTDLAVCTRQTPANKRC